MGGAGIAVMILLWSELYACLSPVRICLYYATSLLAGAAIVYVYRGFMAPWQPAMVCLLPVVSLLCLRECYRRISDERRPPRAQASFTFPWKPIAVVAIYAFAFGLQEVVSYADWGPHSSPGMVACALVVVAGIALLPRFVEFGTIYATWLPFLSATFLILPALGFLGGELAGACSNLGYAASEIYVMTMIGSISYHYGVRAVWLFGIERGVRAVAMLLGRGVESAALAHGLSVAPVIVVAVLVATFMVFTEKRLSSAWGVRLRPGEEGRLDEAARRSALVERCAELGGGRASRSARRRCSCCWRSARRPATWSASCSSPTARPRRTSATSTRSWACTPARSCSTCWASSAGRTPLPAARPRSVNAARAGRSGQARPRVSPMRAHFPHRASMPRRYHVGLHAPAPHGPAARSRAPGSDEAGESAPRTDPSTS